MNRVRIATVERSEIDLQTGEFPMILATDGEASDGDILRIEGAQFRDAAPLQLSHANDPTATLGTVSGFRRDLQASPKKLRAKGRIELGGEGPTADIRRDLAYMISKGHVSGISVRWEPIEYVRRSNLPSDHPAYVDSEKETDWRKRYGYYHKTWRVLEGSVVAVQADPESMVGRAMETDGAVADFWRSMAENTAEVLERPNPADYDEAEEFLRAVIPALLAEGNTADEAAGIGSMLWIESVKERGAPQRVVVRASEEMLSDENAIDGVPEPHAESDEESIESLREKCSDSFRSDIKTLLKAGFSADDLRSIIDSEEPEPEPDVNALIARLDAQERELQALRARVEERDTVSAALGGGLSAGSRSAADLLIALKAEARKHRDSIMEEFRAYVDVARGDAVGDETKKALANALRARLEAMREKGRVPGDPSPPTNPLDLIQGLIEKGRSERRLEIDGLRAMISEALGGGTE